MNFSEYEILVVLTEELNMRKAAERLFISQPALSQRLQTIERNWNVKIFLRSQRGLILTPAGEKIVALAKEIVTRTNRVKDELQQSEGKVYGTLKLAAASIIAQHWLPDVLKDFTATYPNVKISLITGWTSEMMAAMYESNVHVAIVRGRPEWNGIIRHLFTEQLFLVDKEIQCLDDVFITERPFIQFKSDSTYHQQIQQWWYERYRTFPQRTIIVDQIETCKQLAYAGIGYAILPEIAIKEIDNHMIKIPLTDQKGQPMTRDTWVIGSELSFQLPQVQAFISIIDKHIS
ncbi:transcriptional regulator [Anoxybacillus vitaminiphilus]|uniref:Transcriptional regulator n=1 Tax=Paranoxybacillus vitaminiphilus TaxID=581036 RepID=A0A327YS89_9BACL|nr:LysR family transcriptional regulator [Anoxybacillus vitaminiphilus]RAK23186.1 transcriptional regulator [Anoxybacillus vitaminiphilus]